MQAEPVRRSTALDRRGTPCSRTAFGTLMGHLPQEGARVGELIRAWVRCLTMWW
ncbi:hypothetical protein GZL_04395 [Streptomyces sp. 769]|nr:hypothetical protein GZL_04395 [Streptomyces sp. 769]